MIVFPTKTSSSQHPLIEWNKDLDEASKGTEDPSKKEELARISKGLGQKGATPKAKKRLQP